MSPSFHGARLCDLNALQNLHVFDFPKVLFQQALVRTIEDNLIKELRGDPEQMGTSGDQKWVYIFLVPFP